MVTMEGDCRSRSQLIAVSVYLYMDRKKIPTPLCATLDSIFPFIPSYVASAAFPKLGNCGIDVRRGCCRAWKSGANSWVNGIGKMNGT